MIFQNGKQKVIAAGEKLQFFYDEQELNSQNIGEMLSFSRHRPFKITKKDWELASEKEEGEALSQIWRCGTVEADLVFKQAGQYLAMKLAFVNQGKETLTEFSGSLSMPFTGKGKNKVTIPHMIYNDNPSASPEKIVPHLGNVPGEGLIVEEHRLPIPAVNLEWEQGGAWRYFTLLSMPQVVTGEDRDYWSLGVLKAADDGDVITSLTGPLMFNGCKDTVYGGRCTPLTSQMGYRDLGPGERVSKTYYLDWGNTVVGKGFRSLVRMGYDVLKPETVSLHTPEEMITYKTNVLDTRYYKDENGSGYRIF